MGFRVWVFRVCLLRALGVYRGLGFGVWGFKVCLLRALGFIGV